MSKKDFRFFMVGVVVFIGLSAFITYHFIKSDSLKESIVLNGEKLSFSSSLISNGDCLLAPVAEIAKVLGAVIEDTSKDSIRVTKNDITIDLTVKKRVAKVNGKDEIMSKPAKKENKTIMAPVTFLAQKLGAKANWNSEKKTVDISVKGSEAVAFLGDSLTENFKLRDYFNCVVVNYGKNGDNTFGAISRMRDVINLKPRKIFIMLGTNDVCGGIDREFTIANYRHIISLLKMSSPETEIIIQSVLPIGSKACLKFKNVTNQNINDLNIELQKLANEYDLKYVDVGAKYKDKNGNLDAAFSADGIHVFRGTYNRWADVIRGYLN